MSAGRGPRVAGAWEGVHGDGSVRRCDGDGARLVDVLKSTHMSTLVESWIVCAVGVMDPTECATKAEAMAAADTMLREAGYELTPDPPTVESVSARLAVVERELAEFKRLIRRLADLVSEERLIRQIADLVSEG